MISKHTFKTFSINRCRIMLTEAESLFLFEKFCELIYNSKLTEENLQGNIKNILKEFHNSTENRYFSYKNLNDVSFYYSNLIKEEIGRGRESKISDPVSSHKVAKFYGNIDITKGVDTFGEEDILYVMDDEGNEKQFKVDNPDHSSVILNQIKHKAIVKNNL